MKPLPDPDGPLSEAVVRALTADGGPRPAPLVAEVRSVADPLADRDLQLALWMLYELHYGGFDCVDPALEWDPLLLSARIVLEQRLETAIRALAGPPVGDDDVVRALVTLTRGAADPELARYLQRQATADQLRAYLAERAVYHLRESDPQSFVLPRIDGPAKTALAELQYDEYGGGRPDRLHAALYARALERLGMPTDLASYVDTAAAVTLASVNTMSLFCLNRRLRGAALGHLAAFEATSSVPCRMIADGVRRLGLPDEVAEYYDEHVEADAVHEQLAIRAICGGFVETEPELAADVVFGAAACLAVDALAAEALLARWRDVPVRHEIPDRVSTR